MKLIIAGGRDYIFDAADKDLLTEMFEGVVYEVVSGAARGADTEGELWALEHNIPITKFPADWNKLGKAAGFIRNTQMAEYADAVVLFPGGKGTDHMFKEASKRELVVYDWRGGAHEPTCCDADTCNMDT